jgi:hypothetical protein
MRTILAFLFLACAALAQSHYLYLITVASPVVPPAGSTANIYRLDGACPVGPTWTAAIGSISLGTGTTAGYTDTTVVDAKTYCYMSKSVWYPDIGEGPASNLLTVVVPPWPLPAASITGKAQLSTSGAVNPQ